MKTETQNKNYWEVVQNIQNYIVATTDKLVNGTVYNGKKRVPRYILQLKKDVSVIDFLDRLKQYNVNIDKLLPYKMKMVNDKVIEIQGSEHFEYTVASLPTENIYDLSICLKVGCGYYLQCIEGFLELKPLTFPKPKKFDVFSVDYTEVLTAADFNILIESLVNSQLLQYTIGYLTIEKGISKECINRFVNNEITISFFGRDCFFKDLKSPHVTEIHTLTLKFNYWKVKVGDYTFKLYQLNGHIHFNITTQCKIVRKEKKDYLLGEFKKWTCDFTPITLNNDISYGNIVKTLVKHLQDNRIFIESFLTNL